MAGGTARYNGNPVHMQPTSGPPLDTDAENERTFEAS
jgi:hypothetical protein